ncbi:cell wall-binding repeat-containing protein [Paenibacillus sp. UNC499MF]|uniref:cell wall-binding repeat-containing protein n=1 Tax=Paenibacillus sp. UNC499MF TaxID=1502751 RepID=UPI00089FB6D2|nr:cell wall-binding repeat-containing protein [Paenibacillus sp. UNC499MF]SEF65911.1 Putative cell wall binding repeat 2 [Paenibacillus sp. UNC499MF]
MKKRIGAGMIILTASLALTGCFGNPSNNTAGAGATAQPATAGSGGNDSKTPWIASKNTTRINSSDPFEAAVLTSRTLWMATSDDNRPGGVVLVNPEEWQAALASADLIHHPNNGPVLFVNKDGIPDVTVRELKRLKPAGVASNQGVQAILVGNLDPKVEKQAKELGLKTDKIPADNPAAAAKAIDAYYAKVAKETPPSVIVGSSESKEYTMPAVNWISHMPEPLLYVSKDQVPQETIDALKTRGGKANIYLLGPDSVISAAVEKQLGEYGKVVRIAGKDPVENSIAFAKYKDPATGFGWGITTPGHNFSLISKENPDLALAAAPFSHLGKHAPLIWTEKDKLPDSVMTYLMSVQPKYDKSPVEGPFNHAWLTGDERSVSAAGQGEIDSMLEIVSKTGGGHGSHGGMSGMPAAGDQPPAAGGGTGDSSGTSAGTAGTGSGTGKTDMPGMSHSGH